MRTFGTLQPLAIDAPACAAQQRGDAAIAIAAIGAGQPNNRRGQRRFVVAHPVRLALDRARLANGPASPPFRDAQPLLQMDHALALGA